MLWLWIIAGLTVFIAWYTSPIGREWLKQQPWAQVYYRSTFAERVEIWLFRKSDAILYQRFKLFLAAAWQFVLQVGAIDPTPFLILIPQEYHTLVLAVPSLILAIDGLLGEIQRRWVTKPVALVELPETKPLPPDVAAVVAKAEVEKEIAVAVVQDAKKMGDV